MLSNCYQIVSSPLNKQNWIEYPFWYFVDIFAAMIDYSGAAVSHSKTGIVSSKCMKNKF